MNEPRERLPYRGYQLRDISLLSRPLRQPVEVWQPIVSGSARGMDFMARNGIKGVIRRRTPGVANGRSR